ncbi:hypothetical protein SCA6_010110 [Theobroma cacao]
MSIPSRSYLFMILVSEVTALEAKDFTEEGSTAKKQSNLPLVKFSEADSLDCKSMTTIYPAAKKLAAMPSTGEQP